MIWSRTALDIDDGLLSLEIAQVDSRVFIWIFLEKKTSLWRQTNLGHSFSQTFRPWSNSILWNIPISFFKKIERFFFLSQDWTKMAKKSAKHFAMARKTVQQPRTGTRLNPIEPDWTFPMEPISFNGCLIWRHSWSLDRPTWKFFF